MLYKLHQGLSTKEYIIILGGCGNSEYLADTLSRRSHRSKPEMWESEELCGGDFQAYATEENIPNIKLIDEKHKKLIDFQSFICTGLLW